MAAHEPDGTTTGSSPANARSARRATGRAWSGWPALHPGWPQQVWRRGTTTSTPARSSTVRAARATEGATMSARQVRISRARIAIIVAAAVLASGRVNGPDPVSTERYRIGKRAADPEDRVTNREPMELRTTLRSSLSLPKQQY